jgi:hypothetical protein
LKIEYERDFINSIQGSLYKVARLMGDKATRGYNKTRPGNKQNDPDVPLGVYPQDDCRPEDDVMMEVNFYGHRDPPHANEFDLGRTYPPNWNLDEPSFKVFYFYIEASYLQLYQYDKYLFRGRPNEVGGVHPFKFSVDCDDAASFTWPPSGWPIQIHILKPATALYCGDIRVKKLTKKGLVSQVATKYTYPDPGEIEVLPDNAYPWPLSEPREKFNIIEHDYFSPDMTTHYNTGSTSVIYPTVQVHVSAHTDVDAPNPNYGYTKYNFFTWKDRLAVIDPISNITVSVPICTTFSIRDKFYTGNPLLDITYNRITDRSAIVGQIKSVEQFDKNDKLVSKKEKLYKFIEELGSTFFNSLTAPVQQPLGFIRERTIRLQDDEGVAKEAFTYNPRSVTDLIVSRPFVVGEKATMDGVEKTTSYGCFNAITGSPMATQERKPGPGCDIKKTTLTIPFNFITTPAKKAALEKKNIHVLSGAALLTSKDVDLTSSSVIDDILSDQIQIASATADKWQLQEIPSDNPLLPDQNRFYQISKYSWRGIDETEYPAMFFEMPELWSQPQSSGVQWLKNFVIDTVDNYSRPMSEYNAKQELTTAIYHPYASGMVGRVSNAHLRELALYTCDYDDYLKINDDPDADDFDIEDGWFDKSNGVFKRLERGTVELNENITHFGKRSLHITNSWGIGKDIYVDKTKPYLFSCFVNRSTDDPVFLKVDIMNTGTPPTVVSTIVSSPFSTAKGLWEKVTMKLTSADLNEKLTGAGMYLSIGIGSGGSVDCFVDDIRFYPADALVQTFYYDHNLKIPIAIVDENSNAKYYRYDDFGRLVEKGVFKNR